MRYKASQLGEKLSAEPLIFCRRFVDVLWKLMARVVNCSIPQKLVQPEY